jgi:hypothetical protein
MCVAWELEGEDGLRKRRLCSGRWLPGLSEKKSTRAPARGVVEGVSWPHIFSAAWAVEKRSCVLSGELRYCRTRRMDGQ